MAFSHAFILTSKGVINILFGQFISVSKHFDDFFKFFKNGFIMTIFLKVLLELAYCFKI